MQEVGPCRKYQRLRGEGQGTILVGHMQGMARIGLTSASRWKHAATCHQGSQVPGDDDFYEQDDVFRRLEELGL